MGDSIERRMARWVTALIGAGLAALVATGPATASSGDLFVTDHQGLSANGGGVTFVGNSTGKRLTVSDNNRGNQAPFYGGPTVGPYGLAWDSNSNLVVSGTFTPNDMLGLVRFFPDLANVPLRSLYSGVSKTGAVPDVPVCGGFGTPACGPDFHDPRGIALEGNGKVLVTDVNPPTAASMLKQSALIEVDQTGARKLISDRTRGTGPQWHTPIDVAIRENGDILVLDQKEPCSVGAITKCGSLYKVDPVTGNRTQVSTNKTLAAVPDFNYPTGLTVSAFNDQAYVANGIGQNIIRVDPDTSNASGNRSTVSDNSYPVAGAGSPTFSQPRDLVELNGFYVTDGGDKVIMIERNGTRHLVSDATHPSGSPNFGDLWGIEVEPVGLASPSMAPTTFAPEPRDNVKGLLASARRGTKITYRLSEAATLTIKLFRKKPVHCKGEKSRKRCVRWIRSGKFSHKGHKGKNSLRFSGRRKHGALKRGRYRALLVAQNARGVRSVPRLLSFKIVKG